jgi:hypothetical protein
MQLRSNLYRGVGVDKLSTKQGKETSYAYRVARVTGSLVTMRYILALKDLVLSSFYIKGLRYSSYSRV